MRRTISIQIYSSKDAVERRIRSLIGHKVRVIGRPFGAITMHHHALIVMDVSRIAPF